MRVSPGAVRTPIVTPLCTIIYFCNRILVQILYIYSNVYIYIQPSIYTNVYIYIHKRFYLYKVTNIILLKVVARFGA